MQGLCAFIPFSIFIAEVIFIVCGFGQSSHCVGGDSSNVREIQLRLGKLIHPLRVPDILPIISNSPAAYTDFSSLFPNSLLSFFGHKLDAVVSSLKAMAILLQQKSRCNGVINFTSRM